MFKKYLTTNAAHQITSILAIFNPPSKLTLPNLHQQKLNFIISFVFMCLIGAHLPWLLGRAALADEKLKYSIPMVGDDGGYQIPAINLINGYGYTENIRLPLEEYRLDLIAPAGVDKLKLYLEKGPEAAPYYSFHWAPGTSLMLAGVYRLFGTKTIVAQVMMAMAAWLTALLLLFTGSIMAGWLGALAGGMAALYHLHFFPGINNFERIVSENPTALWVAIFCFLYALYLKRGSKYLLFLAAAGLGGLILLRANFLPILFFITLHLILLKCSWRLIFLFVFIAALPGGLWSYYASSKTNQFVFVTAQGSTLFAETNNIDILEGLGPERFQQGNWNPGFYKKADGTWAIDGHNQVKAGENGWEKGLAFWKNNLARLPELFYVKLRVGFWYNNEEIENWLKPEGLYLAGIGYLLVALGFLPFKLPFRLSLPFNSQWLLTAQLLLICLLFVIWNSRGFGQVLITWLLLLILSLMRLCLGPSQLPFHNPVWFLSFVICHGITTMVYYGVRFHHPVDSYLMLLCFIGILTTAYEALKRNLWLFIGFACIIFFQVLLYFYYLTTWSARTLWYHLWRVYRVLDV